MKPSLYEMFVSFLKIGTLLLGGGYVIVPLLNNELVDKKGWVTKEDVIDFYALGQCVPGIIAANTTLFIGYKLRGKTGALAAFFGLILPPFLAIILFALILVSMLFGLSPSIAIVLSALLGIIYKKAENIYISRKNVCKKEGVTKEGGVK